MGKQQRSKRHHPLGATPTRSVLRKPSARDQIELLVARDGHRCEWCRRRKVKLTRDHLVPASQLGSFELVNLALACRPCNLNRQTTQPDLWRRAVQMAMKAGALGDDIGPAARQLIEQGALF